MPSKNTFSLYLAKEDVSEFDDLLTDAARQHLNNGYAKKLTSDAFGDGGALYTFAGRRKPPNWAEQLKKHFPMANDLWAQSPCAILVFSRGNSIFAITFSYGHVYLDDRRTEADFGLKVAINFVSDEQLKSVERSNIGEAIREFAQAANQRDLRSFGFDDALDLIRKVTGYASENDFADKVTGSRALRFSKAIDINEVPDAAATAIDLFKSKAYQSTSFRVIDFLAPVLDFSMQSLLDQALLEALQEGSDEFEISLPEILPDDVGSFRFERMHSSKFYPDLSLEVYRDNLGDGLTDLTVDQMKAHRVAAYDLASNKPFKNWSVHQSLVGSLVINGGRYALNEGLWYAISEVFKEAADAEFVELTAEADKRLRPFKKILAAVNAKKKKDHYQSEGSYNQEIADETGYLLLDERLVQIEDVPGPGVEACDLLDVEGRRFIHVKKSSRQSSVLSHLFKQGSNSAQLVRKYEAFKDGITNVIRKHYGDAEAAAFEAALTDKWTVEFQIADYPRVNGQHNIPFFSKLTLRDEARVIRAMEFDVRVGFITLSRI